MNRFNNAEAICRISDPLNWTDEKNTLMAAACREMALYHMANCPAVRHLYERRGFNPASVSGEAGIAAIPAVGVQAMKYHLLTSLPDSEAVLKLTSSGTRGQKTQIWFDQTSLDRVQAMLDGLWGQQGLISAVPTNYLMFVYDPKNAKDLGITFSIRNQQRFAPEAESYFALKMGDDGQWQFPKDELRATLARFVDEGKPVRLHGIPAFIFEMVADLRARGESVTLPENSYMLTGGGWKAAEDKKVSREVFRSMITETLGMPDAHILDGYGMAEHSAPYMECPHHRFHVPVYCRILIRNPETMAVLPAGEPGLIELVTPFNTMMPNLAVLSTDLGCIDPEPCTCGYTSPTFTLLGRGGLAKHKGCAMHASEIVGRK